MLPRLICSLVLAGTLVNSLPILENEVDERDVSGFGRFLHPGEAVSTSFHRFYTAVPAASHLPPPQDTYTTAVTHTTPTIPLPSSRTVSPVIASHNSTSTLNHLPGISTAPTVPSSKSQGTVINTDYGNFRGKPADKGAEAWLGIPFAAPPIGDLRFAPPVPPNVNYGDYDTTKFGYSCPQMGILQGALPGTLGMLVDDAFNIITSIPLIQGIAATNQAEDCLTLNIVRPPGISADAKLPVMVWVFGGAFLWGGTSTYDGTGLVARSVKNGQPMIWVSVNYRTNSFGFLPGRESGGDPTVSVNAGLQDVKRGLEWVADYIHLWGGDPSKVTLTGESAGAIAIGFLMISLGGDISYKGQDLFRAAIMESGSALPCEGPQRGQHSFDTIANHTGCNTASDKIACLRSKDWKDIQAGTNLLNGIFSPTSLSLPFIPRTDGTFLPYIANEAFAGGHYAKMPVINGNQYDEGSLLAIGTIETIHTSADVENFLATVWFPNTTADQRATMLALYPEDPTQGSPFDTGYLNILTPQNKRVSALVGDFVFQTARRSFLSQVKHTQPAWSYVSRVFHTIPILGSFHFSDILAVYGYDPLTPSTEIQSRWIAFVNTMDPNVAGYIHWPKYGDDLQIIQFSSIGSWIITDNFRQAAIAYWTSIVAYLAF